MIVDSVDKQKTKLTNDVFEHTDNIDNYHRSGSNNILEKITHRNILVNIASPM